MRKRIFANKGEGRQAAQYLLNVYLGEFKVAKEKNQPDTSNDYMNKLLGAYSTLETLGLISYEEWDKLTDEVIKKQHNLTEV